MYRDDVDRAFIPDKMVIPDSSFSLQMVDHTMIDVPLANVYLNSPLLQRTLQSDDYARTSLDSAVPVMCAKEQLRRAMSRKYH